MGAYLLKRLLLIFPTLFGIMVISFAIVQFAPGGPVERVIALVAPVRTAVLAGNFPEVDPIGLRNSAPRG